MLLKVKTRTIKGKTALEMWKGELQHKGGALNNGRPLMENKYGFGTE